MTARGKLVLLGAGGHAKVVLTTARAAGFDVVAVFDDDKRKWGTELLGVRVRGALGEAVEAEAAVIALGDNGHRRTVAERLDLAWVTLVHPSAEIDGTASLGLGTVVFAGAVVQAEAQVGDHVIVNTAATIDHDCHIGNYAHLAPGVHLAGGVQVGEGATLGIASAAIPGVRLGAWSTLGAGGVALEDTPPRSVAVGVPAKVTGRPRDQS